MKILINRGLSGGPRAFKDRIIDKLRSRDGVDVVHSGKFDVELAFIRTDKRHKKPVVLRLDGCYYESGRMGANKAIEKSANRASRLVFQSKFSKKMFKKLLKINIDKIKKSAVIHNGIDLDYIRSISASNKKTPLSFVCAASWRTNKRPMSIVRGFLHADISGSVLYVIGNNFPKKIKDPRVKYLGSLSKSEVIGILKSCNFLLHLCHVDSCPNIVVESLACGLSVLHTNLGGTKELVDKNGINMEIDAWKWKPIKSVRDNISGDIVADGINRLIALKRSEFNPESVSIDRCVDEYIEVMRSVL